MLIFETLLFGCLHAMKLKTTTTRIAFLNETKPVYNQYILQVKYSESLCVGSTLWFTSTKVLKFFIDILFHNDELIKTTVTCLI